MRKTAGFLLALILMLVLLVGNGSAEEPVVRPEQDITILFTSDTHCDKGAVFGSFDGEAIIVFRDSKVRLYGEGYRVSGFGSLNGSCVTLVESGEIDASLLAVEVLLLGNDRSRYVVTGGNIHLAQESDHPPVSPAGIPLCFANPGKDHYEAVFRDEEEEWTYKADRNADGYLGVWILL